MGGWGGKFSAPSPPNFERQAMRHEPNLRIDQYRDNNNPVGDSPPGVNWGFFRIPRQGDILRVMSSGTAEETGWEHISISLKNRCPTWEEMCYVKNLFWREDETVIQFHPKKSKYVNRFPYCLHIWKSLKAEHQLPPDLCV